MVFAPRVCLCVCVRESQSLMTTLETAKSSHGRANFPQRGHASSGDEESSRGRVRWPVLQQRIHPIKTMAERERLGESEGSGGNPFHLHADTDLSFSSSSPLA